MRASIIYPDWTTLNSSRRCFGYRWMITWFLHHVKAHLRNVFRPVAVPHRYIALLYAVTIIIIYCCIFSVHYAFYFITRAIIWTIFYRERGRFAKRYNISCWILSWLLPAHHRILLRFSDFFEETGWKLVTFHTDAANWPVSLLLMRSELRWHWKRSLFD